MKNIYDKKYKELWEKLIAIVKELDQYNSDCFNSKDIDDETINNLCILTRNYYFDNFPTHKRDLKNI